MPKYKDSLEERAANELMKKQIQEVLTNFNVNDLSDPGPVNSFAQLIVPYQYAAKAAMDRCVHHDLESPKHSCRAAFTQNAGKSLLKLTKRIIAQYQKALWCTRTVSHTLLTCSRNNA